MTALLRGKGSWVALVTPFLARESHVHAGMHHKVAADNEIDRDALIRLLDWHCDAGTQGILVLGTTGESPTVRPEERRDLIQTVVSHLAGRVPVMVGTGSYSTEATITLTRQAYEWGADCALIVCPYYNRPTQRGLFSHYKAVAEAVPIPQLLYNVPSRTGCDLLPETVAQLALCCPNIVGLKEASAGLDRLAMLQLALKKVGKEADFLLYSGEDAHAKRFIEQGGEGLISVTANVCPTQVCALVCAARQGEGVLAEEMAVLLAPLNRALFLETNPIPVKWVLHKMGYVSEVIRLPLTGLSQSHQAAVYGAWQGCAIAREGKKDAV